MTSPSPPTTWNPLSSLILQAPQTAKTSAPWTPDKAVRLPPYPEWLSATFPDTVTHGLADRHHELWAWAWSLRYQRPSESFSAFWPRGGGKSASAELIAVACGRRRTRRFVLYVSGTQAKANAHIRDIAKKLRSPALYKQDPALTHAEVTQYGQRVGWANSGQAHLHTAAGLVIYGYGLDADERGIKVDDFRPDLIVLDDVDELHDSAEATARKIRIITQSILPSGSEYTTTLFIQNLLIPDGVAAQLADQRAEFLTDRIISGPHPAVRGLVVERIDYAAEHYRTSATADGGPTGAPAHTQPLAPSEPATFDKGSYHTTFSHQPGAPGLAGAEGQDESGTLGGLALPPGDSRRTPLAGGGVSFAGAATGVPDPAPLRTDRYAATRSLPKYRIIAGTATWEGQNLKACETFINQYSLESFLKESQHEVEATEGGVFEHVVFEHCSLSSVPPLVNVVVAVDPAATKSDRSDSNGVDVKGVATDGTIYDLWSWEQRATPRETLLLALTKCIEYRASFLVVETTHGGQTWDSVVAEAWRTLKSAGRVPRDYRMPTYVGERTGVAQESKTARGLRMLTDYEAARIVHVINGEQTHAVLEKALRRAFVRTPHDMADCAFWSWYTLRKRHPVNRAARIPIRVPARTPVATASQEPPWVQARKGMARNTIPIRGYRRR